MQDDANKVPRASVISTDLCVVGAGAAGITIARELAGGRHRVMVLESGAFEFDERTQRLYRGTSSGIDYDLEASRVRFFGGSTNHWSAWCRPLDEHDFEVRDWVPNSGWPITRSSLERYYRRAQEVCALGPYHYDLAYWRRRIGPLPTLLDDSMVQTSLFQIGPRTRFGIEYRDEIVNARNVRLLLNANVVNVRTAGARVAGVDVATLDGNSFSVDAPIVVLATGGIENVRLLLASRGANPVGLGNDHDLVGRYFMDHPHYVAGRLLLSDHAPDVRMHFSVGLPMADAGIEEFDDDAPRSLLGALVATTKATRALGVPGYAATLIPADAAAGDDADLGDGDIEPLLGDVDGRTDPPRAEHDVEIFTGQVVHLANEVGVYVRSEPTPNPNSRVTLSSEVDRLGVPRVNLHWELVEQDMSNLDHMIELIGARLGRRGFRPRAPPAGAALSDRRWHASHGHDADGDRSDRWRRRRGLSGARHRGAVRRRQLGVPYGRNRQPDPHDRGARAASRRADRRGAARMTLSRRDFLAALAAAATVPALPSVAVAGAGRDLVRGFFSDAASARRIGELYLSMVPDERDAATLRSLIVPGGVDADEWFAAATTSAFTRHVRTQVRADFGSAFGTRTVVLSGWVLAVTEARLCALFAVEDSG